MNLKITVLAASNQEFVLTKFDFSEVYTAVVKGSNNGFLFELRETAATPEEAVNALYDKWLHLTDRVPELLSVLPPPDYGTYEVVDDEIPF